MSRGNPGILLQLADGRKVFVANKQPFLATKGMVVMELLDDDLSPQLRDDKKPKTIFRSVDQYNLENQEKVNTFIGYAD